MVKMQTTVFSSLNPGKFLLALASAKIQMTNNAKVIAATP
jgi:hypothetical protein